VLLLLLVPPLQQDILGPLQKLYVNRNDSDLANDWNQFRRAVMTEAIVHKLLPQACPPSVGMGLHM
jgi:hypothetical protein